MDLERTDSRTHTRLMAVASEMDHPDGLTVEVFGGNIVPSPSPKWSYFKPMKALLRQLASNAPEGFEASDNPFKFVFPTAQGTLGPDVYVVDPDIADNESPYAPCESLALVSELTSSSTRANDLTIKLDIYGTAGVPVYLLFDMKERQATVYSEQSGHGFRSHTTTEFGKPVHIPEPFDFELDTSVFVSARQSGVRQYNPIAAIG